MREEEYIKQILQSYNLKVTKIPESTEKTPDFLIEYKGINILLELKTKLDDKNHINKKNNILQSGKIFHKQYSLRYQNTISRIIKESTKQLISKKNKYNADLCFLGFLPLGEFPEEQALEIKYTLYGIKQIMDMTKEPTLVKDCYYYTYSEFIKHQNIIDGVFLFNQSSGLHIFLNEFSKNNKDFLSNSFIRLFLNRPTKCITLPNLLEKDNKILICDLKEKRTEENINNYVKEKYNLASIMPLYWPRLCSEIRIRTN